MKYRQPMTSCFEALEQRVHRSFTVTTNPYISEISGYSLFAEAAYGDEADPWGLHEVAIGNSSNYASSDIMWDSDLSDGLDSGSHNIYFRADAGDDLGVWWVDGGELLSGTFSLNAIGSVVIRVAVMLPDSSVTLESAAVGFFNQGRLVHSQSLGNIQASTYDGGWQEETIVEISVPSMPVDEVRVGGALHLESAQGNYPSPNDLFAQVFVFEPGL